ncbi:MAG: FliA/WhiG family RNA polymerase sigma factor [Vicinamibacterales bacterium]|nr:FliA/WhiG family RNA polymerase sigma factor [Vicinamibacterales bacterium]
MRPQTQTRKPNPRVAASLPFVQQLARRVAATMPHSIDLGDLVQDGVIGLIDAANRFDEKRGIKFETFAERRVRGAMIDALRKDAWPRGVRRQRRELEAAREALRRELGCEPSLADLAARVGSDEKKLGRTIVRINTIEATSPLNSGENMDDASMPAVLMPSEPEQPDSAYEREETKARVRTAIATLPVREQKVIGLYYFNEATMKQIGAEIGVNESRVSQLHARAIRRLRMALAAVMPPAQATAVLLTFAPRPAMVKASLNNRDWTESGGRSNNGVTPPGVVVHYAARSVSKPAVKAGAPRRQAVRMSRPAAAPASQRSLAAAR